MNATEAMAKDPLEIQIDMAPHIQAHIGNLSFQAIQAGAMTAALEAKAREVIETQMQVIHEKEEEIEYLKAELKKYEEEEPE